MLVRRLAVALVIISLLVITFGLGYVTYPLVHGADDAVNVSLEEPVQTADQGMETYWEAWRLLDRYFLGSMPSATDRTYGAIRGMVETFEDPYTFFVEPQPRRLERDELRGRFGGIGASIEQVGDDFMLHPQPEQPAARAGVIDGDMLLLVGDSRITSETTIDDIVAMVRGPVGSDVTLRVRRQLEEIEEYDFTITRAEIESPSMEWRLLSNTGPDAHVGYIKQTLFSERSPEEMRVALGELSNDGADRYILDLRGNPGGLVSAAVEIADMWLDGGLILIEQHADGVETTMEAEKGTLVGDAPLVVVIDGGSASASEILAGALQDHRRAKLVGEQTFGKGSVQLIHELSDRSSLHVTNAQWFTPEHHQISDLGLTPDIIVAAGADPLPDAIASVESVVVAKAQPILEGD